MPPNPPPARPVATTETLAGYRIVRTVGYVAVQGSMHELQAVQKLHEQARTLGGNAVVCARWASDDAGGVIYGTAVVAVELEAQ